jgi:hypothetical protein
MTWASVQRTSDRQVDVRCEPAQDRCERAPVLYEPAAFISRLPQDRSALAQALYKEAASRCPLAQALSHDSHDRGEAVEVLCKTYAGRRQLARSREPLSRILCTRAPVTGRRGGDRCASALDRYA